MCFDQANFQTGYASSTISSCYQALRSVRHLPQRRRSKYAYGQEGVRKPSDITRHDAEREIRGSGHFVEREAINRLRRYLSSHELSDLVLHLAGKCFIRGLDEGDLLDWN